MVEATTLLQFLWLLLLLLLVTAAAVEVASESNLKLKNRIEESQKFFCGNVNKERGREAEIWRERKICKDRARERETEGQSVESIETHSENERYI